LAALSLAAQGTPAPAQQSPPVIAAPSDTTGDPTPGMPTASAPVATKTDAPTGFAQFQLDNPVGKALRSLKKDGVDLTLDFVDNLAGNPVGGVRQGFAESHWFMGAIDLDLEKLVGLSNTKIHAQGAWFTGENVGRNYVGNSISFQQTWRPVSGPRLTQLNIEHDFGRFNVAAGRGAVNSYFNNSPFNCVFMSNTSCLTAYGGISNIGITAYPNSSWFAKARYSFDDRWYVQAGAFEYNNDLNLKGKGGLDFSLGEGTGTLIASEVGYQTTFANDRMPKRYKVGLYYNTDGGSSVYYDRNHNSAALTGLPLATESGSRAGIYAMVDQTITRAAGASKRNLALFGRVFANVGNTQQLDWFASAGFVKTGTFKGRDTDTIGFLVSDTHFSNQEMAFLRDRRAKLGGTGAPKADEIVGEINYAMAALPGLRIMPNIQYVINPDPIYATTRKTDIPAAIVVGMRIDVHFAQLFGG
jgi:porin